MLFVFCGVVRFSAVVRFCGAWDCCDDSHGQKWIDSTKVQLKQLRRVIGYLKRNRKKQYTHKFVWAFSVMTSSSPFLPPSLGNTYRLFPLLVFRAEESRTKMSWRSERKEDSINRALVDELNRSFTMPQGGLHDRRNHRSIHTLRISLLHSHPSHRHLAKLTGFSRR